MIANPFWLILLSLLVALIPLVIGLVTSYVKVSIVLGMVRNALGAQQVPSNLVVMALSTALTLLIMGPVLDETAVLSEKVDLAQISQKPSLKNLQQLAPLLQPWRAFMEKHCGTREMFFIRGLVANSGTTPAASDQSTPEKIAAPAPASPSPSKDTNSSPLPFGQLVTAFLLTELKEAFAMAFVVLLPFLVVDLIVANILAGMGMNMVSPVLVSLPLKLLLLVVSDAWILLIKGLIQSYG